MHTDDLCDHIDQFTEQNKQLTAQNKQSTQALEVANSENYLRESTGVTRRDYERSHTQFR